MGEPGGAEQQQAGTEDVRELRTRGLLRRRVDTTRLARSITQLATMQALTSPDDPVERIVDDVLGLVLDGALVRSDHA